MGTTFSSFDTTPTVIVATIKQKILASTDWTHLQLSSGTQNTTLSSGASIGATSISTAITIPSGSCVTMWRSASLNGSATLESRITTGVSGSGPYTVTFADALVNAYNSADAVGVGSYVKCTTTRGAQMVVDLSDSAATAVKMNLAVYRTHDGTTAVDKVTRYINVRTSGGATSDTWHCHVSAGKEHLYFDCEGPRVGEVNADSATLGSGRQLFFLGDIVPYFAGDTTPAVVLVANTASAAANTDQVVYVSRNQGNSTSWVMAHLATLQSPGATSVQGSAPLYMTSGLQRAAVGDSKTYVFPYIIFEDIDGLRGRISKAFHAGYNLTPAGPSTTDIIPPVMSRVSYGGDTYILLSTDRGRGGVSGAQGSPFGRVTTSTTINTDSVVVAIPYS